MTVKDVFLKDVLEGLSSNPKKLSSKYFYDEKGDKLFHYIMSQPEYYLTCAEHEILQTRGQNILSNLNVTEGLRIIEPGAGDGFKTRIFLESALNQGYDIIYNPIDISPNVMSILCDSLLKSFPQLKCEPVIADYFNLDNKINNDSYKQLMMFLGSNLGNFDEDETAAIMQKFSAQLRKGDYFLLGVDLVKDPNRILAAYNDKRGVTAEFNFNLLMRINLELGANFNTNYFIHFPVYNPVMQQAESYLLSKTAHRISIGSNTFHFKAWEPILTEVSRKYTPGKIEYMANYSGFRVIENFYDINKDFCCTLWEKM